MAELRLVGVSEDGEHLVLADGDGAEHTIVIDERLRAGVHGHLSRLGQLTMALESRISPREIQNRVRGGESAEHVAQTAGVPLERVLHLVRPVLREREHVADQARRARLGGTGGPSSLLGDLVARAAQRRTNNDVVTWDSARREDHTWVVTVSWPDGTSAVWTLDLMRRRATPIDAAARRISGVLEDAADVGDNITRDFPDFADSPDFARFDADDSVDVTNSDNVHPFVPRAVPVRDDAADAEADADAAVDDEVVADVHLPGIADGTDAGEPAAEPNGPAPTADAPVPVPPRAQPARSSRRAKVPKWDDIMFGMKPKD